MSPEYQRQWRARNPDKVKSYQVKRRAYNVAWYQRNKAGVRAYNIQARTGLSSSDWNRAFLAQGSICASCQSPDPGTKKGWHTDHDHVTGIFRGILCQRCNLILGHAKDDPQHLRAVIRYLGRAK